MPWPITVKTPKTPEQREAERQELKKAFAKRLEHIVKVSKGEAWDDLFYHLLITHKDTLPVGLKHSTKQEVMYLLQQAWWIEPEDVKQHFLTVIAQHRITSKAPLDFLFAVELRTYLARNKAFTRQVFDEEKYYHHLNDTSINNKIKEDGRPSIEKLFNPKENDKEFQDLSLFDRYLVFLLRYAKDNQLDYINLMSKLLVTHRRQALRWVTYMKNRLELQDEA